MRLLSCEGARAFSCCSLNLVRSLAPHIWIRRSRHWAIAQLLLAASLGILSNIREAKAELTIASFSQTAESGEWYLFEGQLSGDGAEVATVTFSGVLEGATAYYDVDGKFYTWGYFRDGILGYAFVDAVVGDGPPAETFSLLVDVDGLPYESPEITSFVMSEYSDDWCVFTGVVSGTDVAYATVTFSGILEGLSATADESGYFVISAPFPSGVTGTAFARATDGRNIDSSVVSTYVDLPDSSE